MRPGRAAVGVIVAAIVAAGLIGTWVGAPAGDAPAAAPPGATTGAERTVSTPSGSPATAPTGAPRTAGTPTSAIPPPASPGTDTSTPGNTGTSGGGRAIVPGSVGRTSLDLSATYDAALSIGWSTGTIAVDETIDLRNTSGRAIDRLELNTVAARLGRMRALTARVDGVPAMPRIDDQTIVLPLGGVLPDGEAVTVRIGFRATLRTSTGGSNWLFAKANGIVDLYRWLPWVSVRTPFDRPNFGDPFVTPSSPEVTVRIRADRPLRYATSGVPSPTAGGAATFVAANVRDFAITAAPDYVATSGTIDGVRVHVLARPGAPARTLLEQARRALRDEARLVGAYPYPTFTIAESAGGYGMEAPAAIWIPRGLDPSRIPYLVAHETAHQWFYGLVGNDEAREPWVDEATADFLARYVLGQRRTSRCATARLDRPIYDYAAGCYYEVVYIQGGNLIDDVRRRIGGARFWPALRAYVDANRFSVVHERTLLDALDDATPLDLGERLFARRFPSRY